MTRIKFNKIKLETIILAFALIEICLFVFGFLIFSPSVNGITGEPNATVIASLVVARVAPEIMNVTLNNNSNIVLSANSTVNVTCIAIIQDWDNESDVENVTGRLYDDKNSSYEGGADKNDHYRDNNCTLNLSYGTNYTLRATCNFTIEYYANPTSWTCTVVVTDNTSQQDTENATQNVSELLAIGLPNSINYGTVNSTYVSAEQTAEVTNLGNVRLDVNLDGYGISSGDNLSMNCTLGDVGNIPIGHERFNITASTAGGLTLSNFGSFYTNLTSSPVLQTGFNLAYRVNDTESFASNNTYWRMYVPLDVAGTCNGSIVFGAVKG
ncbi:hypothetical protein GOV14_05220 [Candidatus Pacearchaeota archaeon]|nr:hypothetical protein [Candidatus Pacearchaeota archaeon]